MLSPDEIHRLAQQDEKAVGADKGESADCHSDYVAPDTARRIQDERLVSLRVPERNRDAATPGK